MGIPSDRRFLRAARRQLGHLFPGPSRPRTRCTSAERGWPRRSSGSSASSPLARPGTQTTCSCSTPHQSSAAVRWRRRGARASPRSVATATARSHSRYFWGMRLHLACAPDGTPRAIALVVPTGASARWRCRSCRGYFAAERRSSATRATPVASSRRRSPAWERRVVRPRAPQRARSRRPPGAHPPAHRVGLPHLQGRALARAPRRPYSAQPLRTGRNAAAGPRCLHQPQPRARPSEPGDRRLHGVVRGINHLGLAESR